MAGFDAQAAKAAGYSDAEIADYLGQQSKFDVAGARKSGYSDGEIIGHLSAPRAAPADSGDEIDQSEGIPFANANQEAAFGKGMAVEGPQRVWGGVKQLGANAADAAKTFWSGTPSRTNGFVGGSQQLPTSLSAQVTAQENSRQAAAKAAAEKTYGPGGGEQFDVGATAGQTAILAAPAIATDGLLGPTTTLGGNVARQAALGGGQGLAAFSPTDNKVGQAAVGAAGGAAMGTVAAALSAARNVVARAIQRSMGRSDEAYAAAQPAMQWGTEASQAAEGDPTLAMRTGSPTARTFEAQSFNARLQERYQKISDYFATRFKDVFGLSDQPAAIDPKDFTSARLGAETAVKGMSRAASEAYDVGMARAQALATAPKSGAFGASGAAPTVQAPDFGSTLTRLAAADADPIGGSQVLPKDWTAAVQAKLQAGGGSLGVQDTAGVLRRLTGMMREDQPLELRALAHQLRDSFDTDLDLVATRGDTSHPAVQQVLETRAQYKAAQQSIEALKDSAAYKFLGVGPGEAPDPSTLASRYAALPAGRQAEVSTWLRTNAPDVFGQLRGKVLQDAAAARSAAASPAALTENDPQAAIDMLFDKGGVLKTSGLWSDAERAKFEQFRQAMRIVNNMNQKVAGGAGTITDVPAAAATATSHNPIFIARWLTRLATAGKGDLIFSSPEAVAYWTKIRSTSGPTQTAAMAGYANYLANLASPPSGQAPPTQ